MARSIRLPTFLAALVVGTTLGCLRPSVPDPSFFSMPLDAPKDTGMLTLQMDKGLYRPDSPINGTLEYTRETPIDQEDVPYVCFLMEEKSRKVFHLYPGPSSEVSYLTFEPLAASPRTYRFVIGDIFHPSLKLATPRALIPEGDYRVVVEIRSERAVSDKFAVRTDIVQYVNSILSRLDKDPDILHCDWTPAIRELENIGEPALEPTLPFLLVDNELTRCRASHAIYSILLTMHGEKDFDRFKKTLWDCEDNRLWGICEAPFEDRIEFIQRVKRWLTLRRATSE